MTSSVENMEQQILGIVASTEPYEVKKTLIQCFTCNLSFQPMENEACYAILKLSIRWIAYESEALLVESGRMMLMSLAQNKTMALVSFFDEALLLSLLEQGNVLPSCVLDILVCVFPYLKSTSKIYFRLCEVLGHHITTWLKLNDTVEYCGCLAEFLMTNTDCLPHEKEELLKINLLLIQCLGKTKIPNATRDEMVNYFNKANSVCKFLQMIWLKDSSQSFIMLSVKECFEMLSNAECSSTVALAELTNFIPDDVINPIIYEVTMSSQIADMKLSVGISKMVQWLVWPKKTKVFQWLLTFFKCLQKAGKRNILENVILGHILQLMFESYAMHIRTWRRNVVEGNNSNYKLVRLLDILCATTQYQVFSRVFMPVVRESNFIILVNMLMYSLHSSVAFHKIIPFVPNLMDRLRKEKNEKSAHHLKALGELMYTLMYRFSSHETLYEPLLQAMKDIPKPTPEAMNKWLQSSNGAFETSENKTTSPQLFRPEMIASIKGTTRKTGLVNLGNTCYMNSILQCLFMLDAFRNTLMSRRVSPTQNPIMYSLQDVFTFLVMSKRDAIAPESFVRQSRPPWFPSRTQQDCCEFVQYMVDRLEEEDKSLIQDERNPSNVTNIVDENFKGVLHVTYKCLRCDYESNQKEAFTDILLAFPDIYPHDADNMKTAKPSNETHGENPKSLKGGDQIRKFQESVFSDETFENTKENVPNVETTSKAQSEKSVSVGSISKHGADRSTFTLQDMLDYFMKPEKLSGNNQYFCDECRENVDGERRVQISELPSYLMLTLKRFSFDIKNQTKPKLLHIVEFPEELTFCSTGESIKLKQKDRGGLDEQEVAVKEEWDDWAMDTSKSLYSYKLCSVVVHSGQTCEAGHYYSYALDTQSKGHTEEDNTSSQWYCFNDEYANETSYKEFNKREKTLLTDTTYILIYYQVGGAGPAERNVNNEFAAPAEMIERVRLDNIKYFQEKKQILETAQRKENVHGRSDDNDKDDSSPPPGNCGSNGSNFSIPGNRFIF